MELRHNPVLPYSQVVHNGIVEQLEREMVIVLGKTGWGKTQWTKLYIRYFLRLLVYDPLNSDWNINYLTDEELMQFYDDYFDLPPEERIKFKCRIGSFEPDSAELLGWLAFIMTNSVLVLEEMSTLTRKGIAQLPTWLHRIIFLGRHRKVSLITLAQRPASIPIDMRSQANRVVSFQQHENDDVQWLKGIFGNRYEEIATLEHLECLEFHNGTISRYSIAQMLPPRKVEKVDNNAEEVYDDFVLNPSGED